jgi:ferredoxin
MPRVPSEATIDDDGKRPYVLLERCGFDKQPRKDQTMSSIEIDRRACTGCGACVQVCPPGVLDMAEGAPHITRPDLCISCGHCAAACPAEAIVSGEANVMNPFTLVPPASFEAGTSRLLAMKRSTRRYEPDALPAEVVKSLVTHAEMAPSTNNSRKRGYVVLTDPTEIETIERVIAGRYKKYLSILNPLFLRLLGLFSKKTAEGLRKQVRGIKNLLEKTARGENYVFRGAPCVILITAPASQIGGLEDCLAAQQYMMIYAESIGVASCIIGYAQHAHSPISRYLDLPPDRRIFAVSVFGYPKFRYRSSISFVETEILHR